MTACHSPCVRCPRCALWPRVLLARPPLYSAAVSLYLSPSLSALSHRTHPTRNAPADRDHAVTIRPPVENAIHPGRNEPSRSKQKLSVVRSFDELITDGAHGVFGRSQSSSFCRSPTEATSRLGRLLLLLGRLPPHHAVHRRPGRLCRGPTATSRQMGTGRNGQGA